MASHRAPVTPAATAAADDLLALLYDSSGRRLITGQHNQPIHGSAWTAKLTGLTGLTPALWGQEVGFSAPGTLDGIDRRQPNLAEAIGWHHRGALVTYTWHAVCPQDDEPVEFQGGIIRTLDPEIFDAVLDPATEPHRRWCAQVDVAAGLLGQLASAGVPVLWRPYHEMNGPWFWWGGQPERFRALWRLLFERLVTHHGLRNLIWVWSPNAAYDSAGRFEPYFPGNDVVDALAVDTYGGHFEREHYDALLSLAEGRPIGFGELGKLPSPEVLADQPRWSWFMGWPDLVTEENSLTAIKEIYTSPRTTTLETLRS
ncbi:MAG: hypothetical protein JXA67_02955 [Micromonosporaceae bacterium]|nr:hypothetical protein [Micromonosporaceae bacterium]